MAEPAPGPRQGQVRTQSAGLPIGRFFGVPLFLSPSWLFIALLITLTYSELVQQTVDGISTAGAYAVAFAFAVLLAASLLAHELGHTAVSLAFGLPVKRVVIFLLGGVSEIEKEPRDRARSTSSRWPGRWSASCSPRPAPACCRSPTAARWPAR